MGINRSTACTYGGNPNAKSKNRTVRVPVLRRAVFEDETLDGIARMDGVDEALLRKSPRGPAVELPRDMPCPCCGAKTRTPSVDIVIDNLGIRPQQAKILRAVWEKNGHPVRTSRIYDAMYEDDPDGGPSTEKMRDALKVALCLLRKKLEGSGIEIETIRPRGGYRLKITE